MLFNSQVFIIGFLPAVLLLFYAAAGNRVMRQSPLILASLVVYGWWDVRFVPIPVGLTVANRPIAGCFGSRFWKSR